jgi:hypothetical protein
MSYSSKRSSAPGEPGHHRISIDGVEYDVSNLLIQSKNRSSRSLKKEHSSRSLQKERSFSYIGKSTTKGKSPLMSVNRKKREYGLKKAPQYSRSSSSRNLKSPPPPSSHQYSSSSRRNLKSPPPPPPSPVKEEEIRPASQETYNPAPTVEIAPDVYEILRGSVETKQAIQSGAITQVRCCCCTQTVQCIEDAAFFICPTCSVISQVPHGIWGVGLGFLPPM